MKQTLATALLLTCLITPLTAHAQKDIEVTKIKNNIYMLVSPKGGNVAVSTGKDGTFIIDDQLAGRSQIIDDAVKTITDKDIQFILNTHYHFDHTGGNEFLGKQGALLVAHDNVRERLSTEQFITFFNRTMPPLSKEGLPVITFSNDMTFHYNDDDIKIIHLPSAHTDGDSIAHFVNENVIVTGDTVFHHMYPFIDAEHGGSIQGLLSGIDILLSLANKDTLIIPGHGTVMTKIDLQDYRDTLASIANKITDAIKNGKTLEQAIAMKPTQEFDAKMNKGKVVKPDAFVSLVYNMLKH